MSQLTQVTEAMRLRHIGNWQAYYNAVLPGCAAWVCEGNKGENYAPSSEPFNPAKSAGDLADAALLEFLNRNPSLQQEEDLTTKEQSGEADDTMACLPLALFCDTIANSELGLPPKIGATFEVISCVPNKSSLGGFPSYTVELREVPRA